MSAERIYLLNSVLSVVVRMAFSEVEFMGCFDLFGGKIFLRNYFTFSSRVCTATEPLLLRLYVHIGLG